MALKKHLRRCRDEDTNPTFHRSMDDIFSCLKLCDLPDPLGAVGGNKKSDKEHRAMINSSTDSCVESN